LLSIEDNYFDRSIYELWSTGFSLAVRRLKVSEAMRPHHYDADYAAGKRGRLTIESLIGVR
jgi:hypothetical protein